MNYVSQAVLAWILNVVASLLARAIDGRSLRANLDRLHTGASVEWAIGLREQQGRHALRTTATA